MLHICFNEIPVQYFSTAATIADGAVSNVIPIDSLFLMVLNDVFELECGMRAPYLFSALAGVFLVAIIFAVTTTVRQLSHQPTVAMNRR
jgi:hypothetical protein